MLQNKVKGFNRKRRTDTQNFYLTSEQIYEQWKIWKCSAAEVKDRIIPEKLALYIKKMAEGITHNQSFVGYDNELKQEMVSDALLKVFRNLKNMKEEMKDSFFPYICRTIYCSIYTTLRKHYKYINLKNKLTEKAIDELEASIGHTANIEQLRAYLQANSDKKI